MSIANQVRDALRQVGVEVGDGPLVAVISRPSFTGPEWDRVPGPGVSYELACVLTAESVRDGAGKLTGEIRRVVMCEAGVVEPLKGDTITIRGVSHNVDEIRTIAPGGVPLMYRVYLER